MSTAQTKLLLPADGVVFAPLLNPGAVARRVAAAVIGIGGSAVLWFGPDTLSGAARLALVVFNLAIVGWVLLRLEETWVALLGATALVAFGAIPAEQLFDSLGQDLIWLLVSAFVIAAVLDESGLAELLARRALGACGSVSALAYRLTAVTVATAFVVPSTSVRAAMLLPVFLALAAVLPSRQVRTLALLFPTVILLSAGASLLGAGAHFIAADAMRRVGGPDLDFVAWLWLAAPFALLTSALATAIILRLFLSSAERHARPALKDIERTPLNRQQWSVAATVTVIVLVWAGGRWHGVDPAIVAIVGAMAITTASGVSLKAAIKKVEWHLILFLAATLAMGQALLDSGAATAIASAAIGVVGGIPTGPVAAVVLAALLSLLAHLVITSRTARAAVLIPTVALPLAAAGVNPALLIFVTVLGSGFCQTLSVSAKPVALFRQVGAPTYSDADLRRLSLALLLPMFGALVLFALVVWPLQGLALAR